MGFCFFYSPAFSIVYKDAAVLYWEAQETFDDWETVTFFSKVMSSFFVVHPQSSYFTAMQIFLSLLKGYIPLIDQPGLDQPCSSGRERVGLEFSSGGLYQSVSSSKMFYCSFSL